MVLTHEKDGSLGVGGGDICGLGEGGGDGDGYTVLEVDAIAWGVAARGRDAGRVGG